MNADHTEPTRGLVLHHGGAHTYERAPHLKWGPFAVIRRT
ncbi:hypothetical protein QF035_004946 [Streptomyces umbrinus]|uniref:Uncharacterized protein n=1 Tax=Streptomyces umbrinus TaxID=67370 RepID=A0ABU0SUY7_9ACTN|nr:hypothetical protein [Streptomyces umbrinus]